MKTQNILLGIILYGTAILLIISLMAYQLHKMKDHHALVNRKLRFGPFFSALMIIVPIILFYLLLENGPEIKLLIGLDISILTIPLAILLILLLMTISKFLYVPIDQKKYQLELAMKQKNTHDWQYYILTYPADTLERTLSLPSWGKRIPTQKEFLEWHHKAQDNPPPKIQWLILLITFIITTSALAILGRIDGILLYPTS